MSQMDFMHLMQFQRQVDADEIIYQPDPEDNNGYFLEHGTVYLIDDEALISKASKNAACTLTGPVILNAPNLILNVQLGCWAIAAEKCKIYIFEKDLFISRFKTEDRFLTAVSDYTIQRIEKAKINLGFGGS
ncbi:MAG: hypothetical protein HOI17_08370 [Alphaproteobacteria bacterium]|jgi:hypothetical protein|nr:hypothetical protein [Alphaproteobacteria bacterium]MBT5799843.1 hypothetical protein [Alphaproteobacteria bacterium]MDC3312199.1 hypothetical protein [Alphaproteobacteria bacterium]